MRDSFTNNDIQPVSKEALIGAIKKCHQTLSDYGSVNEIIGKFGGADQLRNAVYQLQSLLYAT